MKAKVFISVVIYINNDEDIFQDRIMQIKNVVDETFDLYEIILVNDCSVDGTKEVAKSSLHLLDCNLTLINLNRKHGLELAMTAGLEKSIGDFVVEIDTLKMDTSFEMITTLFEKTKEGYDIVVASPGFGVSLKSKLFYKFINRISYVDMNLNSERIRIVSRRSLNAMLVLREKVRYRKALYSFTGFKKYTIYYIPSDIKQVKSYKDDITLAFDVIISFSSIGLKLSHYLSFIFAGSSLLGIGYGFFNFIFNKNVIPGWTTLVVLISMGFSGVFFVMGIIGEYLSRILIEVQNRPSYTVENIETYKPFRYNRQVLFEVATSKEKISD